MKKQAYSTSEAVKFLVGTSMDGILAKMLLNRHGSILGNMIDIMMGTMQGNMLGNMLSSILAG